MIKKIVSLVAVVALSGCAPQQYVYNSQKYDNAEKMLSAQEADNSNALSTITPLPKPLTQKKLVIAFQSESTIYSVNQTYHAKAHGSQASGTQKEIYETQAKSGFKGYKLMLDGIQKKNIYASTQYVEMHSYTEEFAASADTDTLYYFANETSPGQWFYSSLKHGKQVFAFDRSGSSLALQLQAFLDGLQAMVIRE